MSMPCWLNTFAPSKLGSPCLSFFLSLLLFIYFWLIPWNVKTESITQGILASFLLSLSHCWLWTTRFQSIKGPKMYIDTRFTFRVLQNFEILWKYRGFLTFAGTSIKARQAKKLSEAILDITPIESDHTYWDPGPSKNALADNYAKLVAETKITILCKP